MSSIAISSRWRHDGVDFLQQTVCDANPFIGWLGALVEGNCFSDAVFRQIKHQSNRFVDFDGRCVLGRIILRIPILGPDWFEWKHLIDVSLPLNVCTRKHFGKFFSECIIVLRFSRYIDLPDFAIQRQCLSNLDSVLRR